MNSYDVVIVGGGPGGYVAAIRAATNGKKTALVEARDLGGTCLNRGCIPSKTLLKHSEVIEDINQAQSFGIYVENMTFSLNEMIARKDQVIATLRGGIEYLLKQGKIDVFHGFGTVQNDHKVSVQTDKETEVISGEKIIIATGSEPVILPIDGLDTVDYHTTDSIFDITEIPESLTIVGGGVIGVEIASIFASLNTKVTIVELSDRIIPTEDAEAGKLLLKSLKKKGVKVLTKHQLTSVKDNNGSKELTLQSDSGKEQKLETAEILMAVGRKPNLSATAELDLQMDGNFIAVNDYLETSKKNYFAIGDIIGGLQLAHTASAEALIAVKNLDENEERMDYTVIPRCVYTNPQVASVGMSEAELKEQGIAYQVKKVPFSGNGKALASGDKDGFTKVLIEEKYGEILGVVMVGANVTEMISQSSAFMYLEGTVDEMAEMVQPHPSMSEALMEAANALIGKGIHA